MHNHALKEYIILKNSNAPNEITFLFSTEGLTLRQSGNTAVFLDEKGTEVFALGQLFAIDANGEYTDASTYTFTQVKGTDDTLVTVTLDKAYLDAVDRAFPVVIDPTLEISSTKNPDASVYSAHPDTNYKYDNRLRTGKESSYGKCRSYIAFTMPTNITSGQVTEATLSLRKYSGATPAARAYRCEGSWSSGSITWNNMPAYTVVNISSETMPRSSGSSWYEMDVTDMVKYWLNNPSLNYGCVIRDNQESDTSQWTSFYSCDGTSSRIPELHIIYTEEDGDPVVPGEGDDPTIPDPIIPPDEPDVNMPSVELLIQFDNKYAEVCAQESDGDYPETIQHLEEQKNRLQEYFMNNYGLIIWDHSDSYSVFDSYADQHEGDYVVDNMWCENSICTADGTIFLSEDHYTNLSNNLYRIENASPGSVVILSYIGHNICQKYINEDLITVHEYNDVASEPMAGMALAIKSTMAVTDPRGTQWEAVTTIHEMGHMFMVQDHYGWNIELMPGQSDFCIYGNRKLNYNTVSSIVICDYCDDTISNNIYRYGTN